jgi:putative transcriptional regulator
MINTLADLRKQNRLTQAELAERCGVTRQTIISLENGHYNPSIILAHRLAVIFKTTIEQIFIFNE